jgi:cell division septation protein DedD
MPQLHGSALKTGPALAGVALLLLLGGCSAIYDDTKGWANRLEASILEAAHELDKAPDAGEAARYTPEAVEAERAERTAASAMPPKPKAKPEPKNGSEPEAAAKGALAALGDSLIEGGDGSKAAAAGEAPPQHKAQEAMATPPAPLPKPQAKSGAKPKAAPGAGPKAGATPAPDSDVAMVLHLASLRSEQAAKREWSDLQKSYPDNLGGMQAEITRTELGEKGIFYRVLAGPLPTRSAARQTCATLKQKSAKQYCQVMPAKPAS